MDYSTRSCFYDKWAYMRYLLLTLATLSLYFISPSRNKYRPWLTTQPFIGAHKSNIWLYCLISFSRLSLLESYEGENKMCKKMKKSRKERGEWKKLHHSVTSQKFFFLLLCKFRVEKNFFRVYFYTF